jgi:hypothetical protein
MQRAFLSREGFKRVYFRDNDGMCTPGMMTSGRGLIGSTAKCRSVPGLQLVVAHFLLADGQGMVYCLLWYKPFPPGKGGGATFPNPAV